MTPGSYWYAWAGGFNACAAGILLQRGMYEWAAIATVLALLNILLGWWLPRHNVSAHDSRVSPKRDAEK